MMTLKEARRKQKQIESKVLTNFFGFGAIFFGLGFLLITYSGLTEKSPISYLVPFIFIYLVGRKTKITEMFAPKEFIGEVINIDIYNVTNQRVKGERSYMLHHSLEAEIIVQNKKGKKYIKVMPNGDITERLCLGDEIAFLRFIDEPIVIKGNYLK